MSSEYMTSERLRKKFKNNFDLCNFAINVGRLEIMNDSQSNLRKIIHCVDIRSTESLASDQKR